MRTAPLLGLQKRAKDALPHRRQARGQTARTAPLLYLLPPVAGFIAWATLGETFSAWKIVGALMALGGVALAQFGLRR